MKYLSLKTGVLFRLGLIRLFYREGEKKNLNSLSVGYSDQFCQVHGHEITYPESFQRQLKVLKANRPYVFSLSRPSGVSRCSTRGRVRAPRIIPQEDRTQMFVWCKSYKSIQVYVGWLCRWAAVAFQCEHSKTNTRNAPLGKVLIQLPGQHNNN